MNFWNIGNMQKRRKQVENIESLQILKIDPLNENGTPREIYSFYGDKEEYLKAVKELENEIYRTA